MRYGVACGRTKAANRRRDLPRHRRRLGSAQPSLPQRLDIADVGALDERAGAKAAAHAARRQICRAGIFATEVRELVALSCTRTRVGQGAGQLHAVAILRRTAFKPTN
jgi:hypothetical protein